MTDFNLEPVKVFVGSGEASLLERKVLLYSLQRNSKRHLDIKVFNGTHNSLESAGKEPVPVPLSLYVKSQNVTEFSNYRFLIPQLCGFEGKAIWLDSDIVCVGDIGELFDTPMSGNALLCKAGAYGQATTEHWGLSVSLLDCSQCRFDIEQYFQEIGEGLYTYADLHQMTPRFLARHPFRIASLDRTWNEFDYYDSSTKIIHYTGLYTQPWKYRSHPYGDIWFRYFNEARAAGLISDRDIELTLVRSFARRDLLDGNRWTFLTYLRHIARDLRAEARCWRARRARR